MTRRFHPSRLGLLAAGLLVATPALGGCGFDYQTDRINTISTGVNDREDAVNVLGAIIIANQDDVGVFVANLVNTDREEEAVLESVAIGEEVAEVPAGEDSELAAGGVLNLFETGGVEVTGDFGAGSFVEVRLSFSTGQVTTLDANVVPPCRQFSPEQEPGVELPEAPEAPEAPAESTTGSEESAESAESAAEEPSTAEETEGSGELAGTEASEDEGHSEESIDPYSCDLPEPVDHHAE